MSLTAAEVTADLLERYDRPGPRYTSYPTALEFHDGIDADAYERVLARADEAADKPLSLYVHLPFCDERCFFCGCNVVISPDKERARPYLEMLFREVDLLAERLPRRRAVTQLHLGGGTPTYFSPRQLTRLLRHLFAAFPPASGAELAIEVDPRVTADDHLHALSALGFNRVSLGVQDFADDVQHAINRVQSAERTAQLIGLAKSLGFDGVNVDLIYGLPCQDPESFGRTVDQVIEMGADRSAVYSFAHVPWMHAHMKKLPAERLPERRTKLILFGVARQRFLEAGFEPIGMDHFARREDELARARREGRLTRNFQGYSVVPADDSIGLGLSAIGDLCGLYVQNAKKLSAYGKTLEQGRLPIAHGFALSDDDLLRRSVIRELMCNFSVVLPDVEKRFGIRFDEYFAPELKRLERHVEDGMVRVDSARIQATRRGELFVRNLAMCFDRYLQPEGRYSRTV